MAAETIREFLVSLTHSPDGEMKQRGLIESIQLATTKSILMADAIAASISKFTGLIEDVATQYASLTYNARYFQTTAMELRNFEATMSRLGASPGEADAILHSLANAFSNPTQHAQLLEAGVSVTNSHKAAAELAGEFLKAGPNLDRADYLRKISGVSSEQQKILLLYLADLKKGDASIEAQEGASANRSGITEDLLRRSELFSQKITTMHQTLSNIVSGAAMHVATETLEAPLDSFNTWLKEHQVELTRNLRDINKGFVDLFKGLTPEFLQGISDTLKGFSDNLNFMVGGGAAKWTEQHLGWTGIPNLPQILAAPSVWAWDKFKDKLGFGANAAPLKVDGVPIGAGNPMPVKIVETALQSLSGFGALGTGPGLGGGQDNVGGANQPVNTGPSQATGEGGTTGSSALDGSVGSSGGMQRAGRGASVPGSAEYGDLRFNPGSAATAGGPADPAMIVLAHDIQDHDRQFQSITALNDAFHQRYRPNSAHVSGRAGDFAMLDKNYVAARARERARLGAMGLIEGRDFWIEPGTNDHLHVEISQQGSQKIMALQSAQRAAASSATNIGVDQTINVTVNNVSDPWAAARAVKDHLDDAHADTKAAVQKAGAFGSFDQNSLSQSMRSSGYDQTTGFGKKLLETGNAQ